MPFIVYVQQHGKEPRAVTKPTTAGQALRKMGSVISGKNRFVDLQQCYAIGTRFGWIYSRDELAKLVGRSTRPQPGTERDCQPTAKPYIQPA